MHLRLLMILHVLRRWRRLLMMLQLWRRMLMLLLMMMLMLRRMPRRRRGSVILIIPRRSRRLRSVASRRAGLVIPAIGGIVTGGRSGRIAPRRRRSRRRRTRRGAGTRIGRIAGVSVRRRIPSRRTGRRRRRRCRIRMMRRRRWMMLGSLLRTSRRRKRQRRRRLRRAPRHAGIGYIPRVPRSLLLLPRGRSQPPLRFLARHQSPDIHRYGSPPLLVVLVPTVVQILQRHRSPAVLVVQMPQEIIAAETPDEAGAAERLVVFVLLLLRGIVDFGGGDVPLVLVEEIHGIGVLVEDSGDGEEGTQGGLLFSMMMR